MFCYQCEQAAAGKGCTSVGICGKDAQTAALQDLLVHAAQGVSQVALMARELDIVDSGADLFVVEALFTTVTNVNFDADSVAGWVRNAVSVRDGLVARCREASKRAGHEFASMEGPAAFVPAVDLAGLVRQGEALAANQLFRTKGEDVTGLEQLVLYGLKGAAAYADHAHVLGKDNNDVYGRFHKAMAFLAGDHTVDELTGMAMEVGALNLAVMAMLDSANTGTYGHPVPTRVRVTPVAGKAILVSGHDLRDLEELLTQTEGKGINIYTHGEMLPAHAYPGLKKYPHLVGNFGGAWQDQRAEFEAFPGAILMTTNCIQMPKESYKARIFTTGLVEWPGVTHLKQGQLGPLVEAAMAAPGFVTTEPEETILVGFGHNSVLSVAGAVVDAVKAGKIRHFFLVGGCDGAKPGRNYYTEFAQQAPRDTVLLTLACGKYRFNKLEFGDIGGIPRLLDIGQCNDAFSAIQIAVALAQAFNTDVNGLPLSLVLSWYEQKAVAILLTLLHLGVRNIRLGPSAPAFVTPAVFGVLHEKFNLMPITTPEADLAAILGK
jgi:hydroxylamine reductase